MAKGFKHGAGGGASGSGGSELIIVGGTSRPAKATQNMIWVDTDAEITNYVLSAAEPESPIEGMVWVYIGNYSNIKISSPVGDEWITVYPISAKQYLGGAWVGKIVKSYQNGAWVDWFSGRIYMNGKENVVMTADGYYYANPGVSRGIVAAQKNANHISLVGDTDNAVMLGTDDPVSLSSFSTLYVRGKGTGFADNAGGLSLAACILESKGFNDHTPVAKVDFARTTAAQTVSIPLVGLDGEYYIAVFAHFSPACAGEVYEIWLE